MKYFKQHIESCDSERTIYGSFEEADILDYGDVLCTVYEVEYNGKPSHLSSSIYQDFIEPDYITYITQIEFYSVIEKLAEADALLDEADEIYKALL